MLMNMNQIYETFGRKVGDFVYRTSFKRRTFKDYAGYFREVVSVSQDDDHDYYKVSEAFTKDDLTEYNILKNVRDRFLWYRREGSTDSDAIRKTAEELRIPVEQVEMELEYYGLSPNVGRAGEVPAETPKSPVTVTNPGYRTHDLPVTTRSESKRKREKNMKRKRKPRKKQEARMAPGIAQDVEEFGERLVDDGWEVEINYGLPYIGVNSPGGEEVYFSQEQEASELLDEVPENVNEKHFILWYLDSAGALEESATNRSESKRKRKPRKMKEMISFDDGEEAIDDFADKIENAGIDWYGIDASLATSMGEYIAFIPNVMRSSGVLIKGYEYEYLSYIYTSKDDIKETIEDAIEMDGEEIASFMGTTVDELDRELKFADIYDLLHLANTVEMYSGLFFEDELPVDAIEVVMDLEDTFRKRGMIEKDEKTKILSKKRKMKESHSDDVSQMLINLFKNEDDLSYIAEDIAKGIFTATFQIDTVDSDDVLLRMIIKELQEWYSTSDAWEKAIN